MHLLDNEHRSSLTYAFCRVEETASPTRAPRRLAISLLGKALDKALMHSVVEA